jgi:hypothetical protein
MLYGILLPLTNFDVKEKIYNRVCKTYTKRGIDNRDWNVYINPRFRKQAK